MQYAYDENRENINNFYEKWGKMNKLVFRYGFFL
jgi:hypothetical protein